MAQVAARHKVPSVLLDADREIATEARGKGCPACGGRLHERRSGASRAVVWSFEAGGPAEVPAALLLFCSLLDERQRRLYAGLESLKLLKLGHGGDRRIAHLLGLDPGTVARGRQQLLAKDVQRDRVRRPGGGHPWKKRPT